MSLKTALVIIAEDSEEIEVVTPIDVLRRVGVKVTIAGLNSSEPVRCARNTMIQPDKALSDVMDELFDLVVLPGGVDGSNHLAESDQVGKVLVTHHQANRLLASICAAALAFKMNRIALGATLTSYPTTKDKLKDDYNYSEEKVVVSGNLITSRGPSTAMIWSLKLVEVLLGEEKLQEAKKWALFDN
ncbi:unnamed protein product, partial [Mesorhabditis belari]|uniref:D-lactate dehydratase n=1 Tax=Mesorhabditis belari TaxID=2138241 RepID=A0AAF3FM55_9BILA